MKKALLFLSLLGVLTLASCNKKNNTSSSDDQSDESTEISETDSSEMSGDPKNLKGMGTIFNEPLGYNTKDASIFEEGNQRYIVYASNEAANGKQAFAARKAVKEAGEWVYQEKHIILKGSDNGWDTNIFNPSIVKGEFSYQGTTYSYLMAYNGNNASGGTNNHIGLAVSNNVLEGWVRIGNSPILTNPEVFEASYGFGSPSLVSYDQKGKGYLFYAVGEREVSFTAVRAYDFSNLDSVVMDAGYAALPITGLTDNVEGSAIIMNAGFALSQDGNSLYMVRDRLPQSPNRPNQTTEVEIDKADLSVIGDLAQEWTFVDNITGIKTMDMDDESSLGWDQIYSGEFVTDPYGKLLASDSAEVIYSTYDENANNPSYSSTLASYEVIL